jgi:ATP diphosphatase
MTHQTQRLLSIMARLRDPNGGCPWDIAQDFKSIAPYTIEEAYEVADAIDRNDMAALKEELGDLLLQSVYHAQMAAEAGLFTFDDVAKAVADKMVTRHPHVFGDSTAATPADVNVIWDKQKDAEKKCDSALDGVTLGLPALLRAVKLQKKAAKVGYVWPNAEAAFDKVTEEIAEFKEAMAENDPAHAAEEWGDLLFCLVNYARMNGIDSEESLRAANAKFERRFKGMESDLKRDGHTDLTRVPLPVWLEYWKKQKNTDRVKR